jgi:aryl-alcohol dehydrogenase-like predicted oxidoreductase
VRRNDKFHGAAEVVAGLDRSLRRFDTSHLDIFFLHGITPASYGHAVAEILPALRREQEKGKFRFLGMTEAPPRDLEHKGLSLALDDDHFDVAMLAFSPTNQNARDIALPRTMALGWGTYIMYVGRFLADFGRVRDTLAALADAGEFPADLAQRDDPLDFLINEGGALDIMDAAYRYARHEPGAHVVLFGSGNREHIARNVRSINSPPLADAALARLKSLFGGRPGVGVQSAAIYGQ